VIKRLITWLYERYGKEPEYTSTPEYRKRYLQAKSIENEFRGAGYTGKPKPDYPKVNGKEPSDSVKKHLDQIYDDAKESADHISLIRKSLVGEFPPINTYFKQGVK
jgi:hypothetical protein